MYFFAIVSMVSSAARRSCIGKALFATSPAICL